MPDFIHDNLWEPVSLDAMFGVTNFQFHGYLSL
jgi:hypothetical protein